jgi:hypothetical protein
VEEKPAPPVPHKGTWQAARSPQPVHLPLALTILSIMSLSLSHTHLHCF